MDRIVSLLLVMTIDWLVRLTQYFETYIFQDWGFIQYLIIPVLIDTLLGVYIAKKKERVGFTTSAVNIKKKLEKNRERILVAISNHPKHEEEWITDQLGREYLIHHKLIR